MFKLLDIDLAQELKRQVERDGLLWASLPARLKMTYLKPFVERQIQRESFALLDQSLVGAA
jgi:hypothetical protein